MSIKRFSSLMFILAIAGLYSCQESITPPPISIVDNNYLKVSTSESFKKTINDLVTMSEEDLDRWEQNQSFISYRSTFNKAIEEYSGITNSDDSIRFINKYADVIKFYDGHLEPLIEPRLYQIICNRSGYYQTENVVHRLVGRNIYSIVKNKEAALANLQSSNKDIHIQTYDLDQQAVDHNNARIEADCGTYMVESYFDNPSGCNNDRRVYAVFNTYIGVSTSYITLDDGSPYYLTEKAVFLDMYTYGSKRNSFCNWTSYYNTIFYVQNVSVIVFGYYNGYSTPDYYIYSDGTQVVINTNSITTQHSMSWPDYTSSSEERGHYITQFNRIGDWSVNCALTMSLPLAVHIEARTRGTAEFAVINCP